MGGTNQRHLDLLTHQIPTASRDRYNYQSHFTDDDPET